jgi:hypothetical protein
MGWCQHAGTSKNKKVTENFPPASVLVRGLRNEIKKKYYLSMKLVKSKIVFCFELPKYYKIVSK